VFIEPLESPGCTPARAGGKGANLSTLLRGGLPVPDGFVVTTDAYRRLVEDAGLSEWLPQTAQAAPADEPAALDAVSAAIRERFAAAVVPQEIADAIGKAYEDLEEQAVAVRSSATAEDLPDLSFAGQQETFLNVASEPAMLDAVSRCWSSLWTARAIGYRSRHGVGHRDLALAVVIQRMIPSESSGVLFTANPLNGKRTEIVIEATPGLGETLVSGGVEPQRVTVTAPGRIVSRSVGDDGAAAKQVLSDEQIGELARHGTRAAKLLRAPQDIEWAFANGKLWILQSRPITSLYPLPEGVPPEPLQVFFSAGAVQGMLDPFTPLGQDVLRVELTTSIARRFGADIEPDRYGPIVVAGGRLFVNVTRPLRRTFAREGIRAVLPLVEPATHGVLERLFGDPRLAPEAKAISYASVWRFLRVGLRIPFNAALNLVHPAARRAQILGRADAAVSALRDEREKVETLADAVKLLDRAFEVVPYLLVPYLASGIAAGVGMLRLLHALARPVPDGEHLVLEATRGLPHNVTTEMDLALWRAARDPAVDGLDAFLDRYGMRGVGEIDIGRARWREDRSQLLQVMESYRRLPPDQTPDAVFARGAASADLALERLHAELRRRPGGWWRAPLARWAGRRMRALAGLREAPKFFIIRMMGIVRDALLATGGPDIFFLSLTELRAIASDRHRDLSGAILERRAAYDRERRRRRVPRVLMSDGEAWYGDEAASDEPGDGVLTGSGVSPGVVEGPVRIVFDPHAAQLVPGEILVCRGTDPAWTPLFLAAGGLVTEVGGLLTHGSVVAREYGIPAVVGVHEATTRLTDGQRVRVDGLAGRVTLLS
jgi:pyruvate,water dikinase